MAFSNGFQRLGVKIQGTGFQSPVAPPGSPEATANQVADLQQRLAAAPAVDNRNPFEKFLNLNPDNQGWVGDVLQTIGKPIQGLDSGIHNAINGGGLSGFGNGFLAGLKGTNQPLTDGVSTDPRNDLEKRFNLNPNNGFLQDVLETTTRLGNAYRTGVKQDWQAFDQFKQNNGGLNAGNVLDAAKSTLGAFGTGFHEGLTGKDHASAQDALPQQFRQEHPNISALAGLAGDVVSDPTSFVPVGTVASAAGKVTGVSKLANATGDALSGASRLAARDAQVADFNSKIGAKNDQIQQIHNDFTAQSQAVPGGLFDHAGGAIDANSGLPRIAEMPPKAPEQISAMPEIKGTQHQDFNMSEVAAPKIAEVPTDYKIPNNLQSSSPRFKSNTLGFVNDLDKALYIVGNTANKSAHDGAFMDSLMNHTGLDESVIRAEGARVRNAIKGVANGAEQGAHVELPAISNLQKASVANPHAAGLGEIDNVINDLQNQYDTFAKSLVNERNAANGDGILKNLKDSNVRRPLKGQNFYSEYRNLPPEVQRLFKPGNKGKGALSIDEFAAANHSNVSNVLDALNNSTMKHTAADVMDHPHLQDMRNTIDHFKASRAEEQALHDAWKPVSKVEKSAVPIAEHVNPESLYNNANFNSLMQGAPKAPMSKQSGATLTALEKLRDSQLKDANAARDSLMAQRMNLVGKDPRNALQQKVGSVQDFLGNTFKPRYGADKFIGRDGKNFADSMNDFRKNSAFLMDKAISEGSDLVKKYNLKTNDRKLLMKELETPGSVTNSSIVQAAEELHNVYNDWWAMAQAHGYNVGHLEDYAKHLLTPKGRKYLKEVGKNPGASVAFSPQTPLTRKNGIEAKRTDYRSVEEINAEKGFEFMVEDGVKAAMGGNSVVARGIAAQQFFNGVVKNFAIPFRKGVDVLPEGFQEFKLADKGLYGANLPDNIALPTEIIKRIQDMAKGGSSSKLVNFFGSITGIWKTIATTSPSFHFRNGSDNIWKLALGGVLNPKYYTDAFKIMSGKGSVMINGQKVSSSTVKEWFHREGLGESGQFSDTGASSKIDKHLDWQSKTTWEKAKSGNIVQMSRSAGNMMDDYSRTVLFLHELDSGSNMAKAGDKVKEVMFDYGDVTNAEQTIKQFVPFYTFFRKNLPYQVAQYLTNTKRYTVTNYAVQNQKQAMGIDDSNEPQYLKDQMAFPLWKSADGSVNYFAPNLSLADLAKLNPNQIGSTITGMLSPFLKLPIENAMNKDSFTNKPIQKYDGQTQDFLGMNLSPMTVHNLQSLVPTLRDANNTLTPKIDAAIGKVPDPNAKPTYPVYSSLIKSDNPVKDAQSHNMAELQRLGDLVKSTNAQHMQDLLQAGASPQDLALLKKNQNVANGFVPTVKDLKGTKSKGISFKKGGHKAPTPKRGGSVHVNKGHASKVHVSKASGSHAPKVHVLKPHSINVLKAAKNLHNLHQLKAKAQASGTHSAGHVSKAGHAHVPTAHVSKGAGVFSMKPVKLPKDTNKKKGPMSIRQKYGQTLN